MVYNNSSVRRRMRELPALCSVRIRAAFPNLDHVLQLIPLFAIDLDCYRVCRRIILQVYRHVQLEVSVRLPQHVILRPLVQYPACIERRRYNLRHERTHQVQQCLLAEHQAVKGSTRRSEVDVCMVAIDLDAGIIRIVKLE